MENFNNSDLNLSSSDELKFKFTICMAKWVIH